MTLVRAIEMRCSLHELEIENTDLRSVQQATALQARKDGMQAAAEPHGDKGHFSPTRQHGQNL